MTLEVEQFYGFLNQKEQYERKVFVWLQPKLGTSEASS